MNHREDERSSPWSNVDRRQRAPSPQADPGLPGARPPLGVATRSGAARACPPAVPVGRVELEVRLSRPARQALGSAGPAHPEGDVRLALEALRALTDDVCDLLLARRAIIQFCRQVVREGAWRGTGAGVTEALNEHLIYFAWRYDRVPLLPAPLSEALDRAARSYADIAGQTSSNLHRAVLALCDAHCALADWCGMRLLTAGAEPRAAPPTVGFLPCRRWLRRMRLPTLRLAEALGCQHPLNLDRVNARLKREARAAALLLVRAEHAWMWNERPLEPIPLEIMVLKALAQLGRPTPTEPLLAKAGLSVTGTHKALLAQMCERGLLGNHPPKGYTLPAWGLRPDVAV